MDVESVLSSGVTGIKSSQIHFDSNCTRGVLQREPPYEDQTDLNSIIPMQIYLLC